jgi:hypothetical protein
MEGLDGGWCDIGLWAHIHDGAVNDKFLIVNHVA